MNRSVVSACHDLKIIPVSRIIRFVRIQTGVRMMILGDPVDAKEVPGTLRVSSTQENGVIKKKITFERSGISEVAADLLEVFRFSRFIVTYIDETGKRRACGSPEWPLSLEYVQEGGVFSVTVQGKDVLQDGFFLVSSPSAHL